VATLGVILLGVLPGLANAIGLALFNPVAILFATSQSSSSMTFSRILDRIQVEFPATCATTFEERH
jgi:TctA family transporter